MTDEVRLRVLIGEYYQNTFHQTDRGLAEYLMAHGVVVREKGEWEPVTRKDGEQVEEESYATWWRCSVCGAEDYFDNFCPHCGADMRTGENG